ncbi:MAG: hypothetical protein K8I03_15905 [Ignavibacteria bacterium]|nr:hypothetical protein [Ignavibacteria bacterium]
MLKVLALVVQLGMPPTFPEGDASLQQLLPDKIEVICKDEGSTYTNNMHVLKNNPKFKRTEPSLFTPENIKNLYIFLTQIDSTHLFVEDCDYSMLKFLRLKTKDQNLQYRMVDSSDHFVNTEKLRQIQWQEGIGFKMFDNLTVFETTLNNYTEYWECGNKLDYSPKYPYAKPKATLLRKNYTDEQSEDLKYILSNPIMVFSIMPLNEMTYELPYNLEGKAVETKLETSKDGSIEGTGIDLNGDKILDAFWYNQVEDSKIVEVFTRLYINVGGKWGLIWYTYFREM